MSGAEVKKRGVAGVDKFLLPWQNLIKIGVQMTSLFYRTRSQSNAIRVLEAEKIKGKPSKVLLGPETMPKKIR